MAETFNLDLDPKKVIQSLNDMSQETKKLAEQIEKSLGKDSTQAIEELEKVTEKGTGKIAKYFKNLGKSVKDDLKAAFDATKVLSGLGLAESLGRGVKDVFNLERAFDKLNTRLGMTGHKFQDFKKQMLSISGRTGQKMEDIFPGMEMAAAKGGVKSPEQLTSIAESLAQVRATTGENSEGLADTVVEILKNQGKAVTAQSFKATLDALQSTRAQGAFKTATEAGQAVEQLAPYAKKMGLGTREMGGLAATASRSGAAGQDILRQLMEQASQAGGKEKLNAIFGVNLFKGGKLDANALSKINTQKFGKFSEQAMESATGLTGASGADLSRFVDAFKTGMESFQKVTSGADETAQQFGVASDNLATKLDKFREGTVNAIATMGSEASHAANELMKGHVKESLESLKDMGQTAVQNKGKLLTAAGMTVAGAVLAGSGLRGLSKGIGGAEGLAKGELYKAAGVTPVFVVNAKDIGSGGSLVEDVLGGAKGSLFKKIGGAGILGAGAYGAAGLAGVGLGYGAVKGADYLTEGKFSQKMGKPGEWLAELLGPSDEELMKRGAASVKPTSKTEVHIDHAALEQAVAKGTEKGMGKHKNTPAYTNPSRQTGTGRSQ